MNFMILICLTWFVQYLNRFLTKRFISLAPMESAGLEEPHMPSGGVNHDKHGGYDNAYW